MKTGSKILALALTGIWISMCGSSAYALGFGKDKFKKEVEKEQGAVKLARETVAGDYELITTEELKKLVDSKADVLIIDTMPYEDSYKKNHIPGAKQFLFPIPIMETWDTALTDGKTQEDYAALLGENKDKTIVTYCGFVKCTRSHNGAMWARRMGYTKVLRHPGGIFAWKGAEYPTDSVK